MTAPRGGVRGFGYQPERSGGYHFEVRHAASGVITILERYGAATDGDEPKPTAPREKATLSAHRWSLVQGAVASEFNQRLRQAGLKPGKWLKGATPLAPHFGKELILLAWAIDDQDPTAVPRMLANWRGLAPEERWWFYTTINAAPGQRTYGWRAAIKVAFLEDPRDIGLESLRISGESPAPEAAPRAAKPTAKPPAEEAPTQGRLFAEPDAPDYQP